MLTLLAVFTSFITISGAGCPRGAITGLDAETCYVYKTFASWFDAEDYCVEQNGHLASIHDAFTNSFLTQLPKNVLATATAVGIGGRIGGESSTNWTWSDGSAVDFTNWAKGRPLISEGLCLALSAVGENWWTEDCFSSRLYICKLPTVKRDTDPAQTTCAPARPITTCPPAQLACPSGWTYFNVTNKCYKTFHNAYVTWTDADNTCRSVNANLVSIHNYEENLFVQDISSAGVPMQWATGHLDAGVWIGLTNAAEVGTFRWSDGSPLDYDHWAPAVPTPMGPSCVNIYTDHLIGNNPDPWFSHWNNHDCGINLRGCVCQKPVYD